MTPWSQKTIEQKIEASIRHYTKEIERAKEAGDPHQVVGTYEGFVVCLESILEKSTWVGLTVEEIAACCRESTTTQLSFYNAIEAKLKEKNT
jgi:hypothetical protein